jgi:hypothetical protein
LAFLFYKEVINMDLTASVSASSLDLNRFRAFSIKGIEQDYEDSVDEPRRLSLHGDIAVLAGAWNYPGAVDGPLKITNLNGSKTTYRSINVKESMATATLRVGADLRLISGFSVGYDYYLPIIDDDYIGEYRYHWSDPDIPISNTHEGEIEYVKRNLPEGLHNPYLKYEIPFGDDPTGFLWIKAGYQFGRVKFIQGKESYGSAHDAGTIFEDELRGANLMLGASYNILGLNRVLFSFEAGWVGMWGDGISFNGATINGGVQVKF